MEFEKGVSWVERAGEKLGLGAGIFVFVLIAFFVSGKAGFVCWSWRNFAAFGSSLIVAFIVVEAVRRFGGKNGNKIVS